MQFNTRLFAYYFRLFMFHTNMLEAAIKLSGITQTKGIKLPDDIESYKMDTESAEPTLYISINKCKHLN